MPMQSDIVDRATVMWRLLVASLACFLCGFGLHGCGGDESIITITTTTTTTSYLIWQKYSGMRCNMTQDVKAAYDCGDQGNISIEDCQSKCMQLGKCEGISLATAGDQHCHLVRRIILEKCDNGTTFDMYIFAPRRKDVPETNATKAWSLDAKDVVQKANALYQKNDDGVLIHMMDQGLPWQANGSQGEHMSFCLINKAAWSGMIKIYRDGRGTTILGTPTAREDMMKCFFPCDGYSDGRVMQGCGKENGLGQHCDSDTKNEDWCGPDGNVTGSYSPNEHDPGHHNLGWPCAFRPSQLALGLQRQKEYKNGATGPLNWICTWIHPPGESHNEAVIDGFMWNAALPNNVWAFAITGECEATQGCVSGTLGFRQQFKSLYGKMLPVVRVDLHNNDQPFSVFPTDAFEDPNRNSGILA